MVALAPVPWTWGVYGQVAIRGGLASPAWVMERQLLSGQRTTSVRPRVDADVVAPDVGRAGIRLPGRPTAAAPQASASASALASAAGAAGGEEPGEQRVARARPCCAARSTGASPTTTPVVLDQDGAVGAEAGQHACRRPAPAVPAAASTTSPSDVERPPDDLGELLPVGLDQGRRRPTAATQRRPAGVDGDADARAGEAAGTARRRRRRARPAGGCRRPPPSPPDRPRPSTASATASSSPRDSGGPGSLILVTVPSGSARVTLDRVRPAIGHRVTRRCPRPRAAGRAGRPRRRRTARPRPSGTPLASSARETLTPLPPGSRWAAVARMTSPRASRSDLDGPVEARVERHGDDHARTTRVRLSSASIVLLHRRFALIYLCLRPYMPERQGRRALYRAQPGRWNGTWACPIRGRGAEPRSGAAGPPRPAQPVQVGIRTCTEVPLPLGLSTSITPPSASTRSLRPMSPVPPPMEAPPTPSSSTDRWISFRETSRSDAYERRLGVLGRVGHGLGDDVVDGDLQALVEAPVDGQVELDRGRGLAGERLDRRFEAALGQDRRTCPGYLV